MEKEITEVYCGNGRGKTTLAIGQALRASSQGKSVIIIQFLKGNERRELDFLEELDQLDIKIFRFEKMESCYDQLNEEEQAEEERNMISWYWMKFWDFWISILLLLIWLSGF